VVLPAEHAKDIGCILHLRRALTMVLGGAFNYEMTEEDQFYEVGI
jgi:hypothetical protein